MWSASRLAARSLRDEGVVKNTAVFGEHEPNTLAQLEDVASRAERAALMADGHLGYVMPIGGVAAYREQVSVVGVGFDIACGNAAIRTDLTRAGSPDLVNRFGEIADAIQDEISFGIGRKNRADDAPIDTQRCRGRTQDAPPLRLPMYHVDIHARRFAGECTYEHVLFDREQASTGITHIEL